MPISIMRAGPFVCAAKSLTNTPRVTFVSTQDAAATLETSLTQPKLYERAKDKSNSVVRASNSGVKPRVRHIRRNRVDRGDGRSVPYASDDSNREVLFK